MGTEMPLNGRSTDTVICTASGPTAVRPACAPNRPGPPACAAICACWGGNCVHQEQKDRKRARTVGGLERSDRNKSLRPGGKDRGRLLHRFGRCFRRPCAGRTGGKVDRPSKGKACSETHEMAHR